MVRCWLSRWGVIASLLLVLVAFPRSAGGQTILTLTQTIPVGLQPSWVAVNPTTNLLYVTNYGGSTVSVVNAANGKTVATIPVGPNPRSISLNTTTNRAYTANVGNASVSVIDLTTNEVTATVVVGTTASVWHAVVNPTTNLVYVTMPSSDQLAVIDGNTNQVTSYFSTGAGSYPLDVVVNPTTDLVYVTDGHLNSVTVLDGASGQIVATIPVDVAPDRLTINTQTNRVYVSTQVCYQNTSVRCTISVIDTTSNQVITAIPLTVPGTSYTGVPDGIADNEATNRVYVGDLTDPYLLWQIDGGSNQIVATTMVGTDPLVVAVNSQTNVVYTANNGSNDVSIVEVHDAVFLPNLSNGGMMVGNLPHPLIPFPR